MAIRDVHFNMNELAKRAAESVGSTLTECARVEEFPDGMFNKAFLFTMQDDTQVVEKIPTPSAGRAHYTTASEVATMDFVRNHLGTPVPRVLDWSSKANKNPMVTGVQLKKIWPSLDIRERLEVAKSISKYQRAWMSTSFVQYGSLYYSSDLDSPDTCVPTKENGSQSTGHRFAVGPSTGREFLDDGRAALEFDRGPWNSVEQYKLAVRHREIACVQNMTQLPHSPLALDGPGTYRPSRTKKIAALRNYLRISSAFLWHPDLHNENIFVRPERPSEVTAIIDWQSSEILPLFDHARQPYFLDYDGLSVTGLDPPTFPENFDQLEPEKQAAARNERLFRAMEFRQTPSFEMMLAQIMLAAGNPPLPLQFTAGEARSIEEDVAGAFCPLRRGRVDTRSQPWLGSEAFSPDHIGQVRLPLSQATTHPSILANSALTVWVASCIPLLVGAS
ncbi:uncharacterized protein BO95DRAFT_449732 [Aspergillus brunneoviolaceus CBS 621.78]|uniref:Uncharacterized protein n=1 Tax=Aspergillus brunneoviolaceus CBS 621.78 TaxID=1450534 RepID=A0ACD1GMB4_9EURO|nr:hypothetical protein BO95DRAFT_449732 [Aspergillus brunneoviolaceus CBS 621.78]RAH50382.1 hypothetical protein BO95DRAFT_449732 [Aspergillus brunneoviolaceus CBS 621.78]